ncbi:MAG: HAD family phosphatase [Lachnospiraceae bacterium]|nr:HAD family phosphatase [Lachnospiraceae bacterium]
MIKNIIFDIGNVLSAFRWEGFLADKGFDKEMIDRIGNASVRTEAWYEFDKGVYSDEEVVELFVKNDPEIAAEIHKAFDFVEGMVELYPYTMDWLKSYKDAGFKVYYLSNFSYKAETQCPKSLSFIPMMDGGILSYRVKMTKPDPKIYELLLSNYGLKAEECIFIDDTLRNVEAAEKLGIHGVRFLNQEDAASKVSMIIEKCS